MRILLLSQWFDPEPTFKGLGFARALRDANCHVEVLTGFPNYPGGKLYSGYKMRAYHRETIGDIIIHRVPLYPSHDGSAKKRILNYLSFALTSFLFGIFYRKKFDLIYVYHPPLTVGLSAALISLFRRVPFVYDVQDLWPDTLKATGMLNNPRILNLIGHVCDWIYSRASKVVVLSPGFKSRLLERGVSEDKVKIIYNWCDEESLAKGLKRPIQAEIAEKLQGRFNVLFAGNLGKVQSLNTVIDAAEALSKLETKVQFVFLGDGVEAPRLKEIVRRRSLTNVIFIPRVPMSEVGAVLAASDVLLVHLKRDPLFEITVPSKTQAYMAIGKAVLMAVLGDAAALVQRSKCGICIPPEDVNAMVGALLEFSSMQPSELAAMGEAGKIFYERQLSMDNGVREFLDVFRESISKQKGLS